MVDRQALEQFRAANAGLSRLVQAELEDLLRSLDFSRPEAVRDALLEVMPVLTAQYGQDAAVLAAEWYEDQRLASGATGRFTASLAPEVPEGAVQAKVRYIAGGLWTPNPELIIGPMLLAADKYVKQPGRDTIRRNAGREGVKWARVPTGAKTCSFCLMIASRDAAFVSERSASRGSDGGSYHGDCDCQAVRIASKDDYPEDYLPDNYYEMYEAARKEAGSGDIKDIAAAMRRLFPGSVNDGVPT